MRKKIMALFCAVSLAGGILAGCAQRGETGNQEPESGRNAEESSREEIVVTMPTTSEPESGFDPAYGWGAGEHVHEPLIQSTLTVTDQDLKIACK